MSNDHSSPSRRMDRWQDDKMKPQDRNASSSAPTVSPTQAKRATVETVPIQYAAFSPDRQARAALSSSHSSSGSWHGNTMERHTRNVGPSFPSSSSSSQPAWGNEGAQGASRVPPPPGAAWSDPSRTSPSTARRRSPPPPPSSSSSAFAPPGYSGTDVADHRFAASEDSLATRSTTWTTGSPRRGEPIDDGGRRIVPSSPSSTAPPPTGGLGSRTTYAAYGGSSGEVHHQVRATEADGARYSDQIDRSTFGANASDLSRADGKRGGTEASPVRSILESGGKAQDRPWLGASGHRHADASSIASSSPISTRRPASSLPPSTQTNLPFPSPSPPSLHRPGAASLRASEAMTGREVDPHITRYHDALPIPRRFSDEETERLRRLEIDQQRGGYYGQEGKVDLPAASSMPTIWSSEHRLPPLQMLGHGGPALPPLAISSRASPTPMSLLRASARSPAPDSPVARSPMSVHSLAEGRPASPQAERRTRKRRTSSVQEPLQASALEAAARDQTFPRPIHHQPINRPSMQDRSGVGHPAPLPYDRGQDTRPTLPFGRYAGSEGIEAERLSEHQRYTEEQRDRWGYGGQAQRAGGEQGLTSRLLPMRSSSNTAMPVTYTSDATLVHRNLPGVPTAGPFAGHEPSRHEPSVPYYGQDRSHQPPYAHHQAIATSSRPAYGGPTNRDLEGYGSQASQYGYSHTDPPSMPRRDVMYSGHDDRYGNPAPREESIPARSRKVAKHENDSASTPRKVSPTAASASVTATSLTATDSTYWNADLAHRAMAEQDRWARMAMGQRADTVAQSIWHSRARLRSALNYWPPRPSNVTTIRCMYANIAQKSYGSEKRFLCPPPVVKVDGPLRPCKWVSMRVISGGTTTTDQPDQAYGNPSSAITMGGEEPALLDAQKEARFGKLHVGSVSDASNKVFRLQVNLLRAERPYEDGKGPRHFHESAASQQIPFNAWSTFYSSPIHVISKPARKSVRTRAASPAIASGSTVCLYNRLNSQTVRTKYLGIETGRIEDVGEGEVARKLVARQDGWEGFAIELLARPINDPTVARAQARGMPSDEWGITYGSIVCLRDVNSQLCSDPMLICKVDKGRVDLSAVVGNHGNLAKVRFQVISRQREEARQILLGSTRSRARSRGPGYETKGAAAPMTGSMSSEGQQGGAVRSSTTVAAASSSDGATLIGGPVIQMQKVTLMHVTPCPTADSPDLMECDLSNLRAYLCSNVNEHAQEDLAQPAVARSQARLQARSVAVRRGALDLPLETLDAPVEVEGTAMSAAGVLAAEAAHGNVPSSQAAPVGFARPPKQLIDPAAAGTGGIDVLDDQFCWTIVTISCTEVSFIEANAVPPPPPSSALSNEARHLPLTAMPVTPFPRLIAQPSYDVRGHALHASVQEYLYTEGLDPTLRPPNTLSVVPSTVSTGAHEAWLGHIGPLPTQVVSMGNGMADVTIGLPTMERLMQAHAEFHSQDQEHSHRILSEGISEIRLPILLVRTAHGLTFPTGHWLVAEHRPSPQQQQQALPSLRGHHDPLTWLFHIV